MSNTKTYEARVRVTLEVDLYYEVEVPAELSDRNVDLYIEDFCRSAYHEEDLSQYLSNFETVDVELDNYQEISL